MLISRKIKVNKGYIQALCLGLRSKNLIVLRGKKGYVMCGYLNLAVANKFGDVAIMITGASSIKDALGAKVNQVSKAAKKLGIVKNQPIKDVLKIIV